MTTKRHPASTVLEILARGGELKLDGERVFIMQDGKLWYKAMRITHYGYPDAKAEEVLCDPEMPFNTFVAFASKIPEEKLWEAGGNLVLTELKRKDRSYLECPVCSLPLVFETVACPATVVNGVQSVELRGCGNRHEGTTCRRCGVSWSTSSCELWTPAKKEDR